MFSDSVKGSIYDGLFHISDMFPTMLSLTGANFTPAAGYELDGVDQLPAILGQTEDLPREYMLYNHYHLVDKYSFNMWTNGSFAVRNKRYKLMHTYNSSTYSLWYQPEDNLDDDDAITEENRCAASANTDGEFMVSQSCILHRCKKYIYICCFRCSFGSLISTKIPMRPPICMNQILQKFKLSR